jgi:hypothetical protein
MYVYVCIYICTYIYVYMCISRQGKDLKVQDIATIEKDIDVSTGIYKNVCRYCLCIYCAHAFLCIYVHIFMY